MRYRDGFLTRWGGDNWWVIHFHGQRVRGLSWAFRIGALHVSGDGFRFTWWWNPGGYNAIYGQSKYSKEPKQ